MVLLISSKNACVILPRVMR